jgi:hypothetical protein
LCGEKTEEFLTTTTALALRAGFFNGLRVIDSNGRQYTVTKARFLHGVGRFWGYNIFLGRRIRVALDLRESGEVLSVDAVRALVLHAFQTWHGWQARGDFENLQIGVERASTVAQICRPQGVTLASPSRTGRRINTRSATRRDAREPIGRTHFRYTQYINRFRRRSGHLWQGRFYSCALDGRHLWPAIKYVELNPVRAKLCRRAWQYAWSSAALHTDEKAELELLDLARWKTKTRDSHILKEDNNATQ